MDVPERTPASMTDDDWLHLGYEVQDLFSPATPINAADLIAGRGEQITKLTNAVMERGRHAVLFGERGVGKTSLSTTIHGLLPKGRRNFFPIRKPANPSDDFSSLWRRIFAEITTEDGHRVSEHYPGAISPDDVVRELRAFPAATFPIVIVDEFDKLLDQDAKRLTTHTLKALSDEGITATVILIGVAEDISLLVEEHASIKRNITEIPMPRMSDDEMSQILDQRYSRVGMIISGQARDMILTLSRGLPEYVHFLGRDAAMNAISRRDHDIRADDVDAAVEQMVQGADHTLRDAYNNAVLSNKKKNLYKQVLCACALAKADPQGYFIPSDVLPPLSMILKRDIKIANFFGHIEGFCDEERGSILEKKGSSKAYRYRFREPKMQPYVVMKGMADGLIAA